MSKLEEASRKIADMASEIKRWEYKYDNLLSQGVCQPPDSLFPFVSGIVASLGMLVETMQDKEKK